MSKQKVHILLVRAALKSPLEKAMQANGIASEIHFGKAGLPGGKKEHPDELLPERLFWKLINQVAQNKSIAIPNLLLKLPVHLNIVSTGNH